MSIFDFRFSIVDWLLAFRFWPFAFGVSLFFLDRPFMDGYETGFRLATCTILTTFALDVVSFKQVEKLKESPEGLDLYLRGWEANILNNLFIGPVTYAYVSTHLIYTTTTEHASLFANARNIAEMVFWHSVFYYIVHRLMHTSYLYKIHKFHHLFNKIVLASTANAVSTLEYALAYMLPFVGGSLIVKPNAFELLASATVVSLSNLVVHSPAFEHLKLPWFMVSPRDHFEHHALQRKNFAAPTFNIDNIVKAFVSLHHD